MSEPTKWEAVIDEILKAVYGCGRNSRLKLSDLEQIEPWMSVDQAKSALNNAVKEHVIGKNFRKRKNGNTYHRSSGNGETESAPKTWAVAINSEHVQQHKIIDEPKEK